MKTSEINLFKKNVLCSEIIIPSKLKKGDVKNEENGKIFMITIPSHTKKRKSLGEKNELVNFTNVQQKFRAQLFST